VCIFLVQAITNVNKLTTLFNKLENQVKIENLANRIHLVNIHNLEQKLISLGQDHSNKSRVKSLVKDKVKETQFLKGELKISTIELIQTKELV
jgi:hypothetical protein